MDEDVRAIERLIDRQFASMSWTAGGAPDFETFGRDFLPEASLFAAARPVRSQNVERFAERMRGLVGTSLRSFDERVLGTRIQVFGNVAVAVVACENTENGTDVNRNVEMMLLVKEDGAWKIAAQAWDKATDAQPIPADLKKRYPAGA